MRTGELNTGRHLRKRDTKIAHGTGTVIAVCQAPSIPTNRAILQTNSVVWIRQTVRGLTFITLYPEVATPDPAPPAISILGTADIGSESSVIFRVFIFAVGVDFFFAVGFGGTILILRAVGPNEPMSRQGAESPVDFWAVCLVRAILVANGLRMTVTVTKPEPGS
jgi:hypothetical protein